MKDIYDECQTYKKKVMIYDDYFVRFNKDYK